MASKLKPHPLNDMPHTAGIFSDMSVDGPEIGTLVVVVDRAKNLPNRKTIGKQDPYCAARLGKEAKKTTTDIRGGQTPKWDQELRFTVHDSPDYYQLKVSVFNDDKKTELIGEAWIDLRDIVVSGGGQSDKWHQLGYKGKYAGEVRIEITYYDSRPKPEKPAVKAKPPAPAEAEAEPSPAASGARPMPKRRPLPSDPVTGKAPARPPAATEQLETPPRPQQNPAPVSFAASQSQLQQVESPAFYQQQPDLYPQRKPSGEFDTPSRRLNAPAQQYRTPDRAESYSAPPDQGYSPHYQPTAHDRYDPMTSDSYDFEGADNSRAFEDDRPPPPPAHRSRTGSNPTMNAAFQSSFDFPAKGTPPTMRQDVLRSETHRHSASASYPGRPTYRAYDPPPAGPIEPQYPNAEQPPPHRLYYSYDSSYDPSHKTMQPTVEDVPESPEALNNSLRRSSGRLTQSQTPSQPPFEQEYDTSASPAPLNLSGGRGSTGPAPYSHTSGAPDPPRYQGSNGYQMSPSAKPHRDMSQYSPNFGRRSEPSLGSHGSQGDHRALTYRGEQDDASNGYPVPPVPPSLVPGIDPSLALEISERINQDRKQVVNQTRRYTQQALVETPPRGRTMDHRYDRDGSQAVYNGGSPAHRKSPVTYTSGPSTSSVNVVIKSRAYSPSPVRDPSPNPRQQHTIRRKSVSPQPPPANDRRLSNVPFSPDSYDALNPSVSSAAIKDPTTSRQDYDEATGKIIMHDGRQVDPSDHLPMETWAPEPEPRNSKPASSSPSARPSPSGPQPLTSSGRRPLRIAGRPQSMLPSAPGGGYAATDNADPATPSPPASTGRNRLQKKSAYRTSTSAVPVMSGANGPGPAPTNGFRRSSANGMEPTPLAPLPPHQDNFTPPRGHLPRPATFDYAGGPNENYAPPHGTMYANGKGNGNGGSSPGNHRGGPPPPIPAKVPLALPPPTGPVMSGALQLHSSSVARRAGMDEGYYGHDWDVYGGGGGGGPGGAVLSLEEELRQIDIGSGRSRRHTAHTHAHAHAHAQGGY
ncbi:hypothetical protein VTK56DRAFT_6593 [Thermocarpiscus australiensis]